MLDQIQIASMYAQKTMSPNRLSSLFRDNGKGPVFQLDGEYGEVLIFDMHIAYCPSFDDNARLQVGITDRLRDYWERRGIDFRVNLYSDNGIIKNCRIVKYKETCSGHGRPSGHELTPTQQELRIFRRIMDYVTGSEVRCNE